MYDTLLTSAQWKALACMEEEASTETHTASSRPCDSICCVALSGDARGLSESHDTGSSLLRCSVYLEIPEKDCEPLPGSKLINGIVCSAKSTVIETKNGCVSGFPHQYSVFSNM
jgi:hypothetical protein